MVKSKLKNVTKSNYAKRLFSRLKKIKSVNSNKKNTVTIQQQRWQQYIIPWVFQYFLSLLSKILKEPYQQQQHPHSTIPIIFQKAKNRKIPSEEKRRENKIKRCKFSRK